MSRVAFIGLGHMGEPMATHLVHKGFNVNAFDTSTDAMDKLCVAGARGAASARDAVRDASVVITMLPAGKQVKSVYMGSEGVFACLPPGTLVIDCSAIATADACLLASAARAADLRMLDAPVSGGTAGAAAGTLTFMVGGKAEDLEEARPILQAMGTSILHAGVNGAGQTAKICNNMLLGILMAGTAEALALGKKNGLDPAILSAIMLKSSGRNWALELYNPWPALMDDVPASRAYTGGFMSSLMLKDLGLAEQAALASHAMTPLGTLARNLYEMHVAAGNGALDFSSIIQAYYRETDLDEDGE